MICNRTKLLVDTPLYMRIRVSFAAGLRFFLYGFPGGYPCLQMDPPLKVCLRTKAFAAKRVRSHTHSLKPSSTRRQCANAASKVGYRPDNDEGRRSP